MVLFLREIMMFSALVSSVLLPEKGVNIIRWRLVRFKVEFVLVLAYSLLKVVEELAIGFEQSIERLLEERKASKEIRMPHGSQNEWVAEGLHEIFERLLDEGVLFLAFLKCTVAAPKRNSVPYGPPKLPLSTVIRTHNTSINA